jgi:hypothetical protein
MISVTWRKSTDYSVLSKITNEVKENEVSEVIFIEVLFILILVSKKGRYCISFHCLKIYQP